MLDELTSTEAVGRFEAETIPRIEIERTRWTSSGARYRVTYRGAVLIKSARDPEFEACRALKALGISGTIETFFPGGKVPRMRLDIEKGAGLTVVDGATLGPRVRKWSPDEECAEEGR